MSRPLQLVTLACPLVLLATTLFAAPPPSADDLTEGSAAAWAWDLDPPGTTSITNDATRVVVGSSSIKYDTTGGFDTWLWTPAARDANWDLTCVEAIRFWVYAENPSPFNFQFNSPWIRLGTGASGAHYFEYDAGIAHLNSALGNWHEIVLPLAGPTTWSVNPQGNPTLADVDYIEIHADTWDFGFTVWIDGMTFEVTDLNVSAAAGDSVVTVNWDAIPSSPGFQHYAIYRETAPFASVVGLTPIATVANASTSTYDDTSVTNGIDYHYAVVAVGGCNSGVAISSVGPRTPLPATAITATPYYSTMHLEWSPYSHPDLAGYEIYRATSSGAYPAQPVRRVLGRTSFTDYDLTPGATYYYEVVAVDGSGGALAHFTNEESATLSTTSSGLSTHKSFELLMVIYEDTFTPAELARMRAGLELGLEFYWRTTEMQLHLDVSWLVIDALTPGTSTGWDSAELQADLAARGMHVDQYDLAYLVGKDLAGCLGGYVVFGATFASLGTVCGVAYPGNDPAVDYTIAWSFTHEIHHALEALENATPGTPDVIFCHFSDNYPGLFGGAAGHMDWGPHYDGIALTNRLYGSNWLLYPSPYDSYVECIDADGDGFPDADARMWSDEARFGSSPALADSDADGSTDLEEYCAYNFRGTNPNDTDSDADGIDDASDPRPLYAVADSLPTMAPPLIDGAIEPSWPLLTSSYYYTQSSPPIDLQVYCGWDADAIYVATTSMHELRFKFSIDGSGEDGRFESPVRHVDATTTDTNDPSTKDGQIGDSWCDGNHIYWSQGGSTVEVFGRGAIAGAEIASSTSGGFYSCEVKIPRVLPGGCAHTWYPAGLATPVVDGLTLQVGQIFGLQLVVSELAGSNGGEWSGTWTSLFEPHSFVDFELADVGQTFIRGDCNDDGSTNIADAVALLNILFNGAGAAACADSCDFNDDGATNIADAIFLLATLFSGGAAVPSPHPTCGRDPTADLIDCLLSAHCP